MPAPSSPSVKQSAEAWRSLGMKIARVTPKQVDRTILGLIALGSII